MSNRAYHDYDDDRDVITCVTLSDTQPVARMQPISGARPGGGSGVSGAAAAGKSARWQPPPWCTAKAPWPDQSHSAAYSAFELIEFPIGDLVLAAAITRTA